MPTKGLSIGLRPGRPSKIDDVVDTIDGKRVTAGDKIIQLTREVWAPWDVVAKAAGIAPPTLSLWRKEGGLARGKVARGEPTTARERRIAQFLTSLERAEADAVAERLSVIHSAGSGGKVRTKTVTTEDNEGNVTTTTTTEVAPPQWQAEAWLLERRRPADFGRRVEVTGADGAPLVPKEDRADALAAALEAFQAGAGAQRALTEGAEVDG